MMKEMYLAVDHPGTFIQELLEPLAASATAETKSPRKHFAPHLFVLLLAALICVASGQAQAQSFAPTRLRHLATLRASDLPDGSRVTIASDSALDDYRTYRDADRFHILIPQAELSTAINALHGRGFTAIQSERRGPDLDISFVLQPGVTASVTQKFNRLDVTFNLPSNAAASVANIAADAASPQFPASETARPSVALAQGERVSLPATPSATPDPSP